MSFAAICVGGFPGCLRQRRGHQEVSTVPTGPITIGASLSLTGSSANDFSADGQAFERGYELWAKDVNAHGGLRGRPVKLRILNDDSSPQQVVTNYQTLIGSDHVDLVFGPFSSVLTTPASSVAARYGMAMVEGPAAGHRSSTRPPIRPIMTSST